MNKDKFPKVVIGVCTYNRCLGLKRLLQSLIKLDYPNFEIIVVEKNLQIKRQKLFRSLKKSNIFLKQDKDWHMLGTAC